MRRATPAATAQSNPKQAYAELIKYEAQLAGNIDFDYLLGVAALDSGAEVDRGGPYLMLSECTPMESPFVSAEARANRREIGIVEKGVAALESLLFAKYQMYRNVYWHHAVRSATCMFKRAVRAAVAAGVDVELELWPEKAGKGLAGAMLKDEHLQADIRQTAAALNVWPASAASDVSSVTPLAAAAASSPVVRKNFRRLPSPMLPS